MISDLYNADLQSCSESTIRGIARASNFPPVPEIGGGIDDGTASTDVSIITMRPSSPISTKEANTSTNRSTTRVTRSTTNIS